ncbi:MAG: class I SAM-dependent methyltransferase [Methylococcaceae bacterium]|nr:class I SAM-dependent methyltransferase [Methylococcaceae bacterium]
MYSCNLCAYTTDTPNADDLGSIKGNTEKYLNRSFSLWRCPECKTIHSLEPVDFAEIYADYPLNHTRTLDVYARRTLSNLLKRLNQGGLKKSASILDYGCGNGIFVEFLKQQGYANVVGFDPYVEQFKQQPSQQFDVVVLNDVLEHVEDPGALLDAAARLVRKGGLLYGGTADSGGVASMKQLAKHMLRLHQPFHRKIFTQQKLRELGHVRGYTELASYRRSYMDTLYPFGNYRFLDEFSAALGYNMDLALKPESAAIVGKKPYLLFYAFFGYFFPSADEPAVLWKINS